jgi:voltage-dependent anion channel protein 2
MLSHFWTRFFYICVLLYDFACFIQTDILVEDYTSKVSLKCKKDAGPVTVTIETEQGTAGALSSKIGTKFNYAKFNVDKGQLTADGGKVLETSLKLTDDVKLTFKAGKGADLGLDYVKGNFYATGSMDVMEMSNVSTSACFGLAKYGLKVGGEAQYNLKGSTTGLTGVNVGASYATGPVFASVTASSSFSVYNVGLLYKVNNDLSLASQTVHTSSKMCDVLAVGGAYNAQKIGTLKAKIGSNGIISACLIREIAPKVTLTASGTMSASDVSSFKPGLGISM